MNMYKNLDKPILNPKVSRILTQDQLSIIKFTFLPGIGPYFLFSLGSGCLLLPLHTVIVWQQLLEGRGCLRAV